MTLHGVPRHRGLFRLRWGGFSPPAPRNRFWGRFFGAVEYGSSHLRFVGRRFREIGRSGLIAAAK